MGCNIHLHVEIKVDAVWLHYNHPRIEKNYALFAKMADIRNSDNEIDPISEPKGLPIALSETTRLDHSYGHQDWHSMSWLGIDEIIELSEWVSKQF